MKKRFLLAFCAACPAVMGTGLGLYRSTVITKCTDPLSGVLQTNSAPHFTLFFIAASICALICFALAFSAHTLPLRCAVRPANIYVKTARVLTAFLLFASAAMFFLSVSAFTPLFLLKCVFLCVCGAASIACVRASDFSARGLCGLFPLFFMSIYLLSFYRDCARNPLIFSFAFDLLTVVCLLLALYLACCPWFGKHRYGLLLLFTMISTLGSFAVASSSLLSPSFFSTYLPLTAADIPLYIALLLWLWTDLFEFSLPLCEEKQA